MKEQRKWLQGILLLTASLTLNTACAVDNPDAPNLIEQFKISEQTYLNAINNPKNGTRDTIRAYHEYKVYLDKELNKIYTSLRTKLSVAQQKELKVSQRNWLAFRDAEFKFINNNWNRSSFGSSFAISRGEYSSQVIRNRVMQLFSYSANYL
ncbi:MAG: lysozyme inhibitor LprI family protein [Gammaproteobacteria bacterium]|nr:lysozyme inhibitor LprI family protein [Gammaproteobacteria bacterium]